jgi:hypothetical protein
MSSHVLLTLTVNNKSERKVDSLPPLGFKPETFGMLAHLSDHFTKSHPHWEGFVRYTCRPVHVFVCVWVCVHARVCVHECACMHSMQLVLNVKYVWFPSSANIPGSDVQKGETLCSYLQPFPVHGAGYLRYVFVLYKQNKRLDVSSLTCPGDR